MGKETDTEKKVSAGTLRQRKYRAEHLKKGNDARLQVILAPDAKLALDRMAKYYNASGKEILERVLLHAEADLLSDLSDEQAERYRAAVTPEK